MKTKEKNTLIKVEPVSNMKRWYEGFYFNGKDWIPTGWEPEIKMAEKAAEWHLDRFQRKVCT